MVFLMMTKIEARAIDREEELEKRNAG